MPVRPARRPRPALAAVVVGALLACAYLMWSPGHSTMPMPGTAGAAMSAEAGHAETEQPAQAQSEQTAQVVAPMPGECPDMNMECPLATAHPPLPVVVNPSTNGFTHLSRQLPDQQGRLERAQ
ncbi:hypothetical protein GUY60_36985 [Streptomyces sp. YC537]|uniref:Uncharacterized protein n=2 Tax=Streptomyces boluensis TaxID=1775135 RepID=A0A964XRG4_9ACTN|nr:hypothetical protein [Streptomyces boluensis]